MTSHINPVVLKSLIATGVVYIIDNKILHEGDMMSSFYFAAASGTGIYVGTTFGTTLASYVPNVPPSMLGITERVSEIGAGVGLAIGINKYVIKNEAYGTTMGRASAVVAADILSTLLVEYLNGQPLMVL